MRWLSNQRCHDFQTTKKNSWRLVSFWIGHNVHIHCHHFGHHLHRGLHRRRFQTPKRFVQQQLEPRGTIDTHQATLIPFVWCRSCTNISATWSSVFSHVTSPRRPHGPPSSRQSNFISTTPYTQLTFAPASLMQRYGPCFWETMYVFIMRSVPPTDL